MNEKIKNAYNNIQASEELKYATKHYIYEKTNGYNKKRNTMGLKLAISFLTIFVFITAFSLYITPVAAISVDSDSSIELQVNRFNKVIKIEGYDTAGEEIARTISYNFKNYDEVLEEILTQNEGNVNVTISCDDQKRATEMENCINQNHEQVHCTSTSYELAHEAHEHGVSTGIYKAYLDMLEEGVEFEIEDISEIDKHTFHDMVKEEMKNNKENGHNNHGNSNKEESQATTSSQVGNENNTNKGNNGNKVNHSNKNNHDKGHDKKHN